MKKYILAVLSGLILVSCGTVQVKEETEIPGDLYECFTSLNRILEQKNKDEMKKGSEEAMNSYHFGLGMGLRNDWELWKGSRLSKWFNSIGVYHPDDMSAIILDSYYRYLNDKPIKLDEQVKYYQEYWKYTIVPEKTVSPKDGGEIEFLISMPCKDLSVSEHCQIHLGVSKSDGSAWAYQYGKGVFEPNEEQKKKVLECYRKIHNDEK